MSAHIPDPHEKATLFYGWYSNRSAEPLDWLGALSHAEGLAGKPLG